VAAFLYGLDLIPEREERDNTTGSTDMFSFHEICTVLYRMFHLLKNDLISDCQPRSTMMEQISDPFKRLKAGQGYG